MKSLNPLSLLISGLSAAVLGGCQTTAAPQPAPAVLVSADKDSMEMVKTALAKAMKTRSVKLGAGDLTKSPVISVLPPRSFAPAGAPQNQAGNFALPTTFTLMMDGASCYLIKDGTDTTIPLQSMNCKPAPQS